MNKLEELKQNFIEKVSFLDVEKEGIFVTRIDENGGLSSTISNLSEEDKSDDYIYSAHLILGKIQLENDAKKRDVGDYVMGIVMYSPSGNFFIDIKDIAPKFFEFDKKKGIQMPYISPSAKRRLPQGYGHIWAGASSKEYAKHNLIKELHRLKFLHQCKD